MTEAQFTELRDYADGRPLNRNYKPPAALIRNGWLRPTPGFSGFYEITPKGLAAFEVMRTGLSNQ